jgi:serine phosphatase RsbU (regulator of sigma subunit)
MAHPDVVVAVATRPLPSETANGDSWSVDWDGAVCRVCIIDGLGHGPEAAEASSRARELLNAHPELDPVQALDRCHVELKPTRGAAIAIASIDLIQKRLTFAGIGNVEAQLCQSDHTVRFPSVRGIVGRTSRRHRPVHVDLLDGWLMLMHSDGIRTIRDFDAGLLRQAADPQPLVDDILYQMARPMDDATVLVVGDRTD